MTTNKPEVVGFVSEAGIKNLRERNYACDWTLYAGPMRNSTTPLIRLSDYEALQAECESLRRDAERYRWLRAAHTAHPINLTICSVTDWGLEPWSGDDPDAAIDAAMETTK